MISFTWNGSIKAGQRVGFFVRATSDGLIGEQRDRALFSHVAIERIWASAVEKSKHKR